MGPLEDPSPQGVITALPSTYQLGVSNVAKRTTGAETFDPAHCKPANPSPQSEAWARPGPSPYLAVLGQRVHWEQFPKPELVPTVRVERPWMALQLTLETRRQADNGPLPRPPPPSLQGGGHQALPLLGPHACFRTGWLWPSCHPGPHAATHHLRASSLL